MKKWMIQVLMTSWLCTAAVQQVLKIFKVSVARQENIGPLCSYLYTVKVLHYKCIDIQSGKGKGNKYSISIKITMAMFIPWDRYRVPYILSSLLSR